MAMQTQHAGPLTQGNVSTVVVYVDDLERMTRFYRDTLGLRVEQETEHYVELRAAGGADVALHSGRADRVRDRHWFLEFRVDDIEAAVRALRQRGVEVSEVAERPWGKEAGFSDPEGNRLELEQLPSRPAG